MKILERIELEIYQFFKEIESISNEFNKFIQGINLSVLDMTVDLRVASATLLMNTIPSIYRYMYYSKRLSTQKNMFCFKDTELVLDTVLAYDRSIGVICLDSKTTEDMYFGLESAIAVLHPPILVLGNSNLENAIKVDYKNMYNFKVNIKGNSQELGKVYYNAGIIKRK